MPEEPARFGLYLSDLNRDRNDSHGIINYAVGLANALPLVLDRGEHLFIYANREIARELQGQVSDQITIRITPPPSRMQRILADHYLGIQRASKDEVSVLHFPKGFIPILPPGNIKVVATLHDDIPSVYARGGFGLGHITLKSHYFSGSLRHTLRRAHALVTVSHTSLSRFMNLAETHHIAMPPSLVSYQGITPPILDPVPVEDKRPTLLHIGSKKPHKRSFEAIEFMLEYACTSENDLQLMILGSLDNGAELLLQGSHAKRITRTLSGQELAQIMRYSRALIFSSEREGFGLPPVEAFVLGTPAVFAGTDVMLEVLGATPGSYTPHDYADFARAMDNALALDSETLLALRENLLRRYNWDLVARETVKVYRLMTIAGHVG